MKVLTIGGLGFLGRALTQRHLARGDEVWALDNMSAAVVPPSHFGKNPRFRFIMGDATAFVAGGGAFDRVYLLAGASGSLSMMARLGSVGCQEVRLASSALRLCERCGAELVYVSSAEACRTGDAEIERGDGIGLSARSEFAMGKRLAEIMIANRMKRANLPYVIVRPINVAGPYQSHHTGYVLPRFFKMALYGLDLTVYGDGGQRRAFCHLDDWADGAMMAADGPKNQAYNLGAPENEVAIVDLARRVIELTGGRGKLRHVDPRRLHGPEFHEPAETVPAVGAAERLLGWRPKRSLDEILEDARDFYDPLNMSHLEPAALAAGF